MQTHDMQKMGERFKGLRELAKLTQDQFGEIIDMHQSAVSALEKGDRLPTTEQLMLAAEFLGKSMDWLLYRLSYWGK